MNKKGQLGIGEVVGVIALIAVLLSGGAGTIKSFSENRYVADISKEQVYDLTTCSIKNLDQNNLEIVRDLDGFFKEQSNENYTMAKC